MEKDLKPLSKLTVFIGGDERRGHQPLYHAVMGLLRARLIAGATVMKGVMSYGHTRLIHTTLNEITMENLPVMIEAIDEREKIEQVAPLVAEMLGEHGLVQIQTTAALRRGTRPEERRAS
jgi:PII-like signaling protein